MQVTQGQTITHWLDGIGLAIYAPQFTQADVDLEVLPHLTDGDLKELGVASLGHRRKIMHALRTQVDQLTDTQIAEKRFITVLFCDIVGSTALSQTVDTELFSEILNRFHQRVAKTAQNFGGHVAQFLGDGALIYFGSPTPLEDAAASAAFTALRLPSDVRDVAGPDGPQINVRMGIASGLVVVDAQLGGDWLAVGQTVHLASRLQAEAQPGEAIVSSTTAALLRRQFDVSHLDTRPLKGIAVPSELYRLGVELSQVARDMGAAQNTQAHFVNRTKELGEIKSLWRNAKDGGSATVVITGEPGIGKSRLIAEVLATCAAEGAELKTYACSPIGVNVPFFAFRRRLLIASAAGDVEALKLTEWLDASSFTSQQQRRDNRRGVIAALAGYLAGGDSAAPLVLLVEDLHWADPSTREVLDHIQRSTASHRMVVFTSRETSALGDLTTRPDVTHFGLQPLSFDHTCAIVRDSLNAVAGWEDLIVPLAQRADGIPIFAEELANEMRLRKSGSNPSGESTDAIPSSLQQSLQARIQRLDAARPLLRLAASLARFSPVHLLRKLWDEGTSFDVALTELVQSGLARLAPGGVNEPDGLLEIKHQMLRECAYEMILARDRKKIHLAVSALLMGPEGAHLNPALIAEQLERSGQFQVAAEKWAEAGRLAAAQSADAEAATLFRRALALLPKVTARAWAKNFEIETTLALYPVLIGSVGYVAARRDLAGSLDQLIGHHDDADRFMTGMFYQWLHAFVQGDVQFSYDLVESIPPIRASDDAEVHQMIRDRMAGSTLMVLGDYREARICLERMLDTYQPDLHAKALLKFGATDNHVTVLCCMAAIEALDGTKAATDKAIDRVLASADNTGHVYTIGHSLTFGVGYPAIICSDWDRLRYAIDRLSQLADERNLVLWRHVSELFNGILHVAKGDIETGDTLFKTGKDGMVANNFTFLAPTFKTLLEATRAIHTPPDPAVLADLERVLSTGERWMLPLCRSLKQG